MQYIKTIPDFNEKLRDPVRLAPEISLLKHTKDTCENQYLYEIINTKISANDIENIINKVLDKHSEMCKYYINIDDAYWGVSFNVGEDQLEIMCQTMFEIRVYKDKNDFVVVCLSRDITEVQQWSDVYASLLSKLNF